MEDARGDNVQQHSDMLAYNPPPPSIRVSRVLLDREARERDEEEGGEEQSQAEMKRMWRQIATRDKTARAPSRRLVRVLPNRCTSMILRFIRE